MESSSPSPATVEHVAKKSSNELLKKFAQVGGSDSVGKELVLRVSIKRRKRTTKTQSENNSNVLVERKWLLPPTSRRVIRDHLNNNNKSLLGSIQKTWRRTVQGASRVFIDNHYNRHKRLISDVVF